MTAPHSRVGQETLAALLRIHREVLDDEGIGPEDNFYDHGGNSLLALRIIRRIAEELGVRAPARAVFTAPTVADLATQVAAAGRQEPATTPAPDGTSGGGVSGRASMAQEWAILAQLKDPDAPALQFHVAYRVRGPLDIDVLRQALQVLTDHHPGLRTAFRVREGRVFQEVADAVPADLRVEDFSGLHEDERLGQALDFLDEEVRRPFDRATAPLARALLVRCTAEDHLLALVFDHAVADGWSLETLTEQLSEVYETLLSGGLPQLPAAGSYLRWAAQQWERYEAGRGKEVADYWRDQLGPDPAAFALRLPGYLPGSGLSGPAALSLEVPPAVASALDAACRRLRTTPYCVSLAALKAYVAQQTGEERVIILSTSANRLEPEYQDTVGWFANGVFPVTRVDASAGFAQLVEEVRTTSLAATVHGDLPAAYVRDLMWSRSQSGFRKDPGVYFMCNDLWGGALRLGAAEVAPVFLDEHADSPGLHMWLLRHRDGLRLQVLHYRSEYPAGYVRQFAEGFLAALSALCGTPHGAVGDVLPPASL
ncbi:condensation domain-containing protein [Streptomyces sp. NPDC059740]|uniref:condensation domain-containing protein n=1 Tax=Streptomyces sp. NPDC059740 TaxID=3346926 RepID=UPI003661C809